MINGEKALPGLFMEVRIFLISSRSCTLGILYPTTKLIIDQVYLRAFELTQGETFTNPENGDVPAKGIVGKGGVRASLEHEMIYPQHKRRDRYVEKWDTHRHLDWCKCLPTVPSAARKRPGQFSRFHYCTGHPNWKGRSQSRNVGEPGYVMNDATL